MPLERKSRRNLRESSATNNNSTSTTLLSPSILEISGGVLESTSGSGRRDHVPLTAADILLMSFRAAANDDNVLDSCIQAISGANPGDAVDAVVAFLENRRTKAGDAQNQSPTNGTMLAPFEDTSAHLSQREVLTLVTIICSIDPKVKIELHTALVKTMFATICNVTSSTRYMRTNTAVVLGHLFQLKYFPGDPYAVLVDLFRGKDGGIATEEICAAIAELLTVSGASPASPYAKKLHSLLQNSDVKRKPAATAPRQSQSREGWKVATGDESTASNGVNESKSAREVKFSCSRVSGATTAGSSWRSGLTGSSAAGLSTTTKESNASGITVGSTSRRASNPADDSPAHVDPLSMSMAVPKNSVGFKDAVAKNITRRVAESSISTTGDQSTSQQRAARASNVSFVDNVSASSEGSRASRGKSNVSAATAQLYRSGGQSSAASSENNKSGTASSSSGSLQQSHNSSMFARLTRGGNTDALETAQTRALSRSQRQELTSRTVYVNGVDPTVSEGDLREMFLKCGTFNRVRLCGESNGRSRYGFVEFTSSKGAEALLALHKTMVSGTALHCLPAKSPIQDNDAKQDAIYDKRRGCIRGCLFGLVAGQS